MVHATLLLVYSKQPYVCLKVNIYIYYTYYMTSSFQNLLHPSNVTCEHVSMTMTVCDSVLSN